MVSNKAISPPVANLLVACWFSVSQLSAQLEIKALPSTPLVMISARFDEVGQDLQALGEVISCAPSSATISSNSGKVCCFMSATLLFDIRNVNFVPEGKTCTFLVHILLY